jgi:mono/diheme cytochrome c family protein
MTTTMRRRFVELFAVLALLAPALATPTHAEAIKTALVQKGAKLYRQMCSHCHGLNMVNPGNSSFDLRTFPKDERKRFYHSVRHGKGNMPAWGDILKPEEIDWLWAYVSTRGGKEAGTGGSDGARPKPHNVVPAADLKGELHGMLRVCLAENGGAMSYSHGKKTGGLDLAVSTLIAEKLGVGLKVTWFESEEEEESNPVDELNALLTHGLCDLSASFPLYAPALEQGPGKTSLLPDYRGKPREDRWLHIKLGRLIASRPYRASPLVVVLGPNAKKTEIRSLRDLAGMQIIAEEGTLPGAIALNYGAGALRDNLTLVPPGRATLRRLETGKFDAAFVELEKFDGYRLRKPDTKLSLSSYQHSMMFNMGFVALEKSQALITAVNAILKDALADGRIAALAKANKVSYRAPRLPTIRLAIRPVDLIRD